MLKEYKMQPRIFWCHPKVRDYRESFFRLMSHIYSIQFLFQSPSDFDRDFERTYTKNRKIISGMHLISLEDIKKLYQGIKGADIYISSFLWSTCTILGLAIAKLLGKKVIVWEEISFINSDLRGKLKYLVVRLLFRYIDAFFTLGEIHKTMLIQLGAIPEKIFVANEYPGQIYHTIIPQAVSLPWNGNDSAVVLFLGRLVEIKGVEYLIKAFSLLEKSHTNAMLLVVGDGPLRQKLENLARALEIKNIYFVGRITDVHQKAFLFRRSSMVVVPSITISYQREGGPMVVLEALSAGKPVIGTSALGSSKAFIHNGVNGYVVPEKDVEGLFEKIKILLESKDVSDEQVLETFRTIPGYEYQAAKLQEAINYVMNLEKPSVLHAANWS